MPLGTLAEVKPETILLPSNLLHTSTCACLVDGCEMSDTRYMIIVCHADTQLSAPRGK